MVSNKEHRQESVTENNPKNNTSYNAYHVEEKHLDMKDYSSSAKKKPSASHVMLTLHGTLGTKSSSET